VQDVREGFKRCPATVSVTKSAVCHCPSQADGKAQRVGLIREPGDLSCTFIKLFSEGKRRFA